MDNTNNTFLFLKFYNILTLFWRNMSPDLDFFLLKLTVKKCRKFERRVAFPETLTKILNIKRDRSKQPYRYRKFELWYYLIEYAHV